MRREVNMKVLLALADCLDVIDEYQDENPQAMQAIYELVAEALDIGTGR